MSNTTHGNPAHVGRNDPCHCGSGKKRKHCHPVIEEPAVVEAERSSWKWLGLAAVVLAGVVGIGYALRKPPEPPYVPPSNTSVILPPSPMTTPGAPGAFTPPPPGPAPAGKVWSTEHGHWHDIAPQGAPQPMPIITGGDGVLTPIPAPAGFGGSTPASSAPTPAPLTPGNTPPPPGAAPAGKTWSSEHGHWHDIAPQGAPQPIPTITGGAGVPAPTPAPTPAPLTPVSTTPSPAPAPVTPVPDPH